MKKIISILLVLCMAIGFCACSSKKSDDIFSNVEVKNDTISLDGIILGESIGTDLQKKYPNVDVSKIVFNDINQAPCFPVEYTLKMPEKEIKMTKQYFFKPLSTTEKPKELNFDSFKNQPVTFVYVKTASPYNKDDATEIAQYMADKFTEKYGTPTISDNKSSSTAYSKLWKWNLSSTTTFEIATIYQNSKGYNVVLAICND